MKGKTHELKIVFAVVLGLLFIAVAWAQPGKEESERKVKESEVPAAALAAIKKAANGAKLNQIEEEIEHGHKFYEGQWAGPDGKIEVLVTESGDLVETEEHIPADKVPASVRASAEKAAGKDAKMYFEKKTAITYDVHFKKEGRGHEILFAPTGSRCHEEGKGDEDGDGDDD